MRQKILRLDDEKLFRRYLALDSHNLAAYSFQNIYIWRNFFKISWQEIDGCLCVFFKDKICSFIYLGPLGQKDGSTVKKIFAILDKENKNQRYSRIENIEEKELPFYRGLGLECRLKSREYICLRDQLADLSGNKFKSKRAGCNYFTKNYNAGLYRLESAHFPQMLSLHELWSIQRSRAKTEPLYQAMLKDSRRVLEEALENYSRLRLRGKVVEIDGRIRGFTFGYELNQDTFCILFEITDLSFKGLAQYIFRQFCRDLEEYKYINIMDDSGLENLERVKLSYQPVRIASAYAAQQCI